MVALGSYLLAVVRTSTTTVTIMVIRRGVLCVVWCRPGESRRRDCAIAVSAMMLVNDSVCCGINIGRQFPLTADIRAMVVVFVGVCCSRAGTTWVGKG